MIGVQQDKSKSLINIILTNNQSSYRQIVKATSIFGGVQVFQIIIQIIRSKFVALYLGPTGMGIMGLLTSTTGLITNLTNFGLATSAVKDVANAESKNDKNQGSIIIIVLRRLVWITGLLGTIITFIFSPWLSELTFGNSNYTLEFRAVSITLLLVQLNAGQMVILQGLRKINYLAKSNIFGSIIGLLFVVPIYYYYGINGIVPVILFTSIVSLIISTYFSRKISVDKVNVSFQQTFIEGKKMLQLGFIINLSGLMYAASSYLLRIYMSNQGNIEDVGLYNAGFTIITTYVSMIFNAMGTDFYPRLSSVTHSNTLSTNLINQQAEIAILIIAPILVGFIIFIKYIIIILYSTQFLLISTMLYWSALGMLFKTASWCIGFIFLAKGEGKIFFWSELSANIYTLILNIFAYHFWGISGLGISFMVSYFLVLVQVYIISKIKYNFQFSVIFLKLFNIQLVLAIFSFIAVSFFNQLYAYLIGVLLIVISIVISYKELDKRLNLKNLFAETLQKYKSK